VVLDLEEFLVEGEELRGVELPGARSCCSAWRALFPMREREERQALEAKIR
jgi:hypothetical protein